MDITRLRKPRCYLVYAVAPQELPAATANQQFNRFVADPNLPLVIYHDHFIGRPGGVAVFYAEDSVERRDLAENKHLDGWNVEIRPLIFARSPSGFDEQIRFTLQAYRDLDWDQLRGQDRPSYGDPKREAETASE